MREAARAAWANPASLHARGRAAKAVVEDARETVATLAGVSARDVVFTSGGADLHVDAVQAAGRVPTDAWWGADSIALAAHKIRGPKAIGALAVRAGIVVRPLLRGGAQERGLRPGTVDPVGAAGFGVAAKRALGGPARYARLASLRDDLEEHLIALGARLGGAPSVNGTAPRAPHVSNMAWPGWAGDQP